MPPRPLLIAALGLSLAAAAGCSHDADHGTMTGSMHDDHDTTEMKQMAITDAPAPVQSAVMREYPGSHVTYVGKHELGDHTHYHVELTTADGKTVYQTYAPDGKDMSDPH